MYKWSLASARVCMYVAVCIHHIKSHRPSTSKSQACLLLFQFVLPCARRIHTKSTVSTPPASAHSFPSVSSPALAPKSRPLSDRPSPVFPTPGPDLHGTLNAAPGSSDLTATSMPRCDFPLHFKSVFLVFSFLVSIHISSSFPSFVFSCLSGCSALWILNRAPCIVVLYHADITRTAQISGVSHFLSSFDIDPC